MDESLKRLRQHLLTLRATAVLYPDEVRYQGQTVVYGAGHKIIGNIGNGVGLKAETSLAQHRANRAAYIAAKGKDVYNRRARSLNAKANAAAAALVPADRQAMEQKRDELVQVAAAAKTAQERQVARAGAVLLTRHMARYDKATTPKPTTTTTKPKATAKTATPRTGKTAGLRKAGGAKGAGGRHGASAKGTSAHTNSAHLQHLLHGLGEAVKSIITHLKA